MNLDQTNNPEILSIESLKRPEGSQELSANQKRTAQEWENAMKGLEQDTSSMPDQLQQSETTEREKGPDEAILDRLKSKNDLTQTLFEKKSELLNANKDLAQDIFASLRNQPLTIDQITASADEILDLITVRTANPTLDNDSENDPTTIIENRATRQLAILSAYAHLIQSIAHIFRGDLDRALDSASTGQHTAEGCLSAINLDPDQNEDSNQDNLNLINSAIVSGQDLCKQIDRVKENRDSTENPTSNINPLNLLNPDQEEENEAVAVEEENKSPKSEAPNAVNPLENGNLIIPHTPSQATPDDPQAVEAQPGL